MRTSVIVVLGFALFSHSVSATPLPPNSTVLAITQFGASPGTLQATTTSPFTSSLGAGDFSGTVTESVYKDSVTGFLDFLYQFHNNNSSGQYIEQMSVSFFDSFTLDVQQDAISPFDGFTTGLSPGSVTRSGSQSVAWQFAGGGSLGVPPGLSSAILMIKSNATSFGQGNISFINAGTVTLTNAFAPLGVPNVPEPDTFLLVGTGLIGLYGLTRKQS